MVTRSRPRRRWPRIAVPLGVAAALLLVTPVAYLVEHPDPTRPGFLSPTNPGPDGGSDLAAELRASGVDVRVVDRTAEALSAAGSGSGSGSGPGSGAGTTTLFVPAPTLVHPAYLRMLARTPPGTRVLLIDPPRRLLGGNPVPIDRAGRRWAARASDPTDGSDRCVLPEVAAAGPAAALRQRYAAPAGLDPGRVDRCHDGGVARLTWGQAELVVVGASDPFRNDRFAEHRNARLATGLLGTRPQVVWLDLDGPDVPPSGPGGPQPDSPPEGSGPGPTSTTGPADDVPGYGSDDPPPGAPGNPAPGVDDRADPQDRQRDLLLAAFPPWFWATLVLLALALLVLASSRARRLGAPTDEPLPVTVPAAETVLGRGRLYRRSRARRPTAQVLRRVAVDRIASVLGLPARASAAEVVASVAARTGDKPDLVDALLYGPVPATDADLVRLARQLTELPTEIRARPAPQRPGPPAPRPPSAIEGDHR
ncbi:DUF4350 domain-containing protein [Solwaraspora sp. WMMD406]|uniref:DUF4350 domain-containing protein n=1 Tax=Solwaraspora sp. WMMD406 TaxID=3016095 RepID=UPI00241699B2|nr:DUF4350 domain-containing protein [Solwaraspora sp. WMMD406]MDG4763934.1 DUF4350 domain-containing protein [Solwaraspora sp. WMMD406]